MSDGIFNQRDRPKTLARDELARNIKALREKVGLTPDQVVLRNIFGAYDVTVESVEAGQSIPDDDEIAMIVGLYSLTGEEVAALRKDVRLARKEQSFEWASIPEDQLPWNIQPAVELSPRDVQSPERLSGTVQRHSAKPRVWATVFICYRRSDDRSFARHLREKLGSDLTEHRIFMDVGSIEPGLDFVEALNKALTEMNVMLAIVGRFWLNATNDDGNRQLDDPDDYVVMEIAEALRRGVRVIPVLVDGTAMPREHDLPESIKAFSRHNPHEISNDRLTADYLELVNLIRRVSKAGSND